MGQRIVPPPGTPAAELSRLTDEERQLSEREAALLTQGAAVESQARDVQHALDEARAALQRLSTTPARAEAEKGFMQSLSLTVPPHVASAETSRALDLRRKALIARLQALDAEGGVVRNRAAALEKLAENIVKLQQYSTSLAARAAAVKPTAPAPIPLSTPAPAPAPAPIPLTATAKPVAAAPAAPRPVVPAPARAAPVAPAARPVAPAARPAAPIPAARLAPAPIPLQQPAPVARPVAAAQPVARPAPVAQPVAPAPRPVAAQPVAPAAAPFQNTRAAPRQKVNVEVSLSSESNLYTGFSGDLSEGGVFVATYEKLLPQNTQVEIALALPGKPPLKIDGKVAWVRESADHLPGMFPGMGIAFENISPASATVIKDFLQQREPMFWDA